jgi:membrane-associated protease RseP (regulator of RpoE activity)
VLKDESLHPLVRYVKGRLEDILHFVDLEKNGEVVKVNGFRLKNLKNWAVSRERGLFDNVSPFSGYCNLNCDFCYEKGNPLPLEKGLLSVEEVETRRKYFSTVKGTGIVKGNKLGMEPFTNPRIIDILKIIREHSPDFMINMTTNGSRLTEEMVSSLSDLKPIYMCLSLNSSDPYIRSTLMKDIEPEIAINAVKLLRKHGIPYVGSLVPWPVEGKEPREQLDDLVGDVAYLDQNDAREIRIVLPGYSKYFRDGNYSMNADYWDAIVNEVRSIKLGIKTPIVLQPSMYWVTPVLPYVDGVIYNSPAYHAGIQAGDLIRKIDDEKIFSRTQAKNVLRFLEGKEEAS